MTSLHAAPAGANTFVMVTLMPAPGQTGGDWMEPNSKNMQALLQSTLKSGVAVSHVVPIKENAADKCGEKAAALNGSQDAIWNMVRRLQSGLTEEDCQEACNTFKVDKTGQFQLSLPRLPTLPSLSDLSSLLPRLPTLPHYATRAGLLEAVTRVRDQLPTVVGVSACSAALIYQQPDLGLHYATQRVESGLRPWLGSRLASFAARPASVLAAIGGIPLILTTVPMYYSYLVVAEAGRQAVALGADARQLATIVQMIAARCEPIFHSAEDQPMDVYARTVALGLKQHLPDHVESVVQQALYIGERTGNLSPRLTIVLEAAADWVRGEKSQQLLDNLVQMTDPKTDQDDVLQVD